MPRLAQPKDSEPITIHRRKNGTHAYIVAMDTEPPGTKPRRQVKRHFDTLDEAREFVDATRVAIRAHSFIPRSDMTLEEMGKKYFLTRRDIRPVTVQGYRQAFAFIAKVNGSSKVQSLTEPQIQDWVDSWRATGGLRGKGLSQRSICLSLQALRLVLDYGVTIKIIPGNPAAGVRPPRRSPKDKAITEAKKVVWTPAEMRAFLKISDLDPYAAAWRLVCCGMRRSEVLGQRWPDLDQVKGVASVTQGRTKTGIKGAMTEIDDPKSVASKRDVEVEIIHPGSMDMFKALKARQSAAKLRAGEKWGDSDLVVLTEDGKPLNPDSFTARFKMLCQQAGVRVIWTHNTRHTIASLLHEEGVAPAAAAELLGHTVGTHLQFYVRPVEQAKSQASAALGKLLLA